MTVAPTTTAGARTPDRPGRVPARARIRFLIAGARVEWHHLPPGPGEELVAGAPPGVRDDASVRPPTAGAGR